MPKKTSDAGQDFRNIIDQWTERDLTAAAEAGELPPAFEVDEIVQQVTDVLAAGRHPVLIGEPGVGKTAIIYEIVRRSVAGAGPAALEGRRVLQISLRRRASGLKRPDQLRPELNKLMEALLEVGQDIVPFFRDFHLAFTFDLEPQLAGMRFENPVLAEGEYTVTRSMFEYSPDLEQDYVLLNVEEPGFEQTSRILTLWAEAQERQHNHRFSPEALEEALHLAHRFLARSRLPRKALELLGQVSSLTPQTEAVSQAAVIDRFCRTHRVPRNLVDPDIPMDLAEIESRFAELVLGQDEAIEAVVQMIGLIKAGLSDVRRPFGVFLFVGPTGVGKTHVAQLLAEYLFGRRDRMLRFNMADYQKETDPEVLFGHPEAPALPYRRGVLTQRISGHPFAVLLLDEFEKAHPKVHDRFLQLFDEGSFINGAGELVSCRSMILIATSNAGSEVYRGQSMGFGSVAEGESLTRELNRRLAQHFRFEFLNRFDQVVHFRPLTREHIRTIALRELEQLNERAGLKRRGFTLEVDDVVLDWLAAHGYDPYYGARFLRRTIERHVTTSLAQVIVRARPGLHAHIGLSVHHNRITARLVERPEPGARKELVTLPVGTGAQVRSLDRHALMAEAEEILRSADGRIKELSARKDEASAVLARTHEPGFWDNPAESRELLDRYRDLDVQIQMHSRFAEPIQFLRELRDRTLEGHASLAQLARGLERAAKALSRWDEHLAQEGAGAVWMVLSQSDPLLPAEKWLTDLTSMELAWCQKLGLTAAVVAYEQVDGELARVVLEIEGPGAGTYLEMEQGVHRLYRHQEADLRVGVEIFARTATVPARWPRMGSVRRRQGLFGMEVCWSARLELPERGQVMEFLGSNRETLSHLLTDLSVHWARPPAKGAEMARAYGQDGVGARDPRTGVIVTRLKEVRRGELDRFLDGWRQRQRPPNPPG